jgi:hypothetical protein
MQTDDDVQVVVFDSTDPEFFMAHLDPSGRRRSTTRPGSGLATSQTRPQTAAASASASVGGLHAVS